MDNLSSSLINIKVNKLIPLAQYTTWRVGGPAEWLAEPTSIAEIKALIDWAKKQKIPCQIIGAGSNLLINDAGIKGLSICLRKFNGSKIDPKDGLVEAVSGEPLPTLARRAARAGLHGLEWAVGIPGTIGGACVMNAGAQGGCTSERLESIQVLPLDGNEIFELKQQDLNFNYRYSRLQKEPFVVLSAKFKLEPGHNKKELCEKTHQNLIHRKSTQPYELPSCGSVFRNPEPFKAGRLIEDLGLKGHCIGGAEISKTHANFIVNTNHASAKDIVQLIAFVQQAVQKTHGLLLHTEVKQLGFKENV